MRQKVSEQMEGVIERRGSGGDFGIVAVYHSYLDFLEAEFRGEIVEAAPALKSSNSQASVFYALAGLRSALAERN